MPLDTIYLVRHAHRLNWTIDYKTGEYKSQFPTPTGNPADPTLTSHGVRQAEELAAHVSGDEFMPKPFRVYCSPFYRCLQTIQPCVEALKEGQRRGRNDIDARAEFDVRIENGLGEWFGSTTFFDHPPPASPEILQSHFPSIITPGPSSEGGQDKYKHKYTPHLVPSTRGETIAQLHNRVATVLAAIIAEVDAEIAAEEMETAAAAAVQKKTCSSSQKRPSDMSSHAILICSHAAPLIAMGRALTGIMPPDSGEEDFNVFTTGLSTFVRRRTRRDGLTECPSRSASKTSSAAASGEEDSLAPGTILPRSPSTSSVIPDWKDGKGVGGGWDCVVNGDCSFLSGGAERGWHFNGEESFDTGPMTNSSNASTISEGLASASASSQTSSRSNIRTKL